MSCIGGQAALGTVFTSYIGAREPAFLLTPLYDVSIVAMLRGTTINMLLLCGAIAGALIGIVIPRHRVGCLVLLIVPIAMIVYVSLWQAAHPENIRSTSALDFFFGPLWPSVGAVVGFYIMLAFKAWLAGRHRDDK